MITNINIKKLRKQAGISQTELAKMAGYNDRSSIAKIESNLVDLSESKIAVFAHIFGVTPAELMGFSEIPVTDSDDGLKEIVSNFRAMNSDNRTKLLELSRLFLGAQHNNEET